MLSSTAGRALCAASSPSLCALFRRVAWLGAVLWCCGAAAVAPTGPTVQEVVEFTRIIQPLNQNQEDLQRQVSPDGRHAFIVTRRADVATDRNLFEILLLDLAAVDMAAGTAPPPRRLLTVPALKDYDYREPAIQNAEWVGNRHIVFKGQLSDGLYQVYKLDVASGRVTALTSETRLIGQFAVSADLRRVVYLALVLNPPVPEGERSIVVGNHSFWTLQHGQNDWRAQQRRYQYLVADVGTGRPARPLGEVFDATYHTTMRISVSPDGRWALLHHRAPERHAEWARLYPFIAESTTRYSPSVLRDPLGYFSRQSHYVALHLVLYGLDDGSARPVLDAPGDGGLGAIARRDRVWFGGGKSVVIAGTFLPSAKPGAQPDPNPHIVEFWPDSGRWVVVARLQGSLTGAYAVPGERDAFEAVDGRQRRRFERLADSSWQEVDAGHAASGGATSSTGPQRGWTLRIDQGLNQPPDVVAADATGRTVRLTWLNPQAESARWGTVRPYRWTDAQGQQWNGGLLLPAGFDPARRYALVIQAYGFTPARYYLDGSNGADGFTSGFAGRAFLREDMLVLALPLVPAGKSGREAENRHFNDGVKGAIEALVKEGLVDRERVGILGWSKTGRHVLNLVTFSDAPIRAATLLDGDANTAFSMAITYAASDNFLATMEADNEGMPFGEGRENWLRNDPSLHTECIKAALRIETYGPWVLNNWDIYAFLRRQYKPVEMLRIPDGMHALSRPSERMTSLQGNVDWHRFWLKGEQRTQPVLGETPAALADQYVRWNQMAELKREDDAKPRCARVADRH